MKRIHLPVLPARIPVFLTLLLASLAVCASEHEHREHGAHEHGHGTLNIATDGDELAIDLHIPAINVVGFEHEPSTDEQRAAVDQALTVFRDAETLFRPSSGARCEVKTVAVELAGLEPEDEHGHHEHEHESKDEESEHSELLGEFRFHCEAPAELKQLEVNMFDHLRDTEELEVRVVTATLQTVTELHPGDDAVVELAR